MRKKVLSVLLSMVMVTGLVVGCSNSNDKKYDELAKKIEQLENENKELREKDVDEDDEDDEEIIEEEEEKNSKDNRNKKDKNEEKDEDEEIVDDEEFKDEVEVDDNEYYKEKEDKVNAKVDNAVLKEAANYVYNDYVSSGMINGGAAVSYKNNQIIISKTYSKLIMENEFGIKDCDEKAFANFLLEDSDRLYEVDELAARVQEVVRAKYDENIEVVVSIYFSSILMYQVNGDGSYMGVPTNFNIES